MDNSTLDWLLENENPSVRYFALQQMLKRSTSHSDVKAARRAVMESEPVRKILAAQHSEGYWVKPGNGYTPKYKATAWQILFLGELGADGSNRQVRKGCEYLLEHAQATHGGFSAFQNAPPSGGIHCLNGNLVWALIRLGYGDDERVQRAVEWTAGAITGDDFTHYYASCTSGPNFRCSANNKQPCAWGAIKALRALAAVPNKWKSARVRKATEMAAEFLLGRDLAKADYPYTGRISGEWFKFGFPLSYTSDVLEAFSALASAGYGSDPRLKHARELILSLRGEDGRWRLRHSLNGKMWTDVEAKGEPSKWITLRALTALGKVD